MLSVTYFYREPRKTSVSIEGIFHLVKECLKDKVTIKEHYCDPSLSRLQNTLLAKKKAGAINHITGDVHFLALGLSGKKNILTIHDLGHYDTLKKKNFIQYYIYKLFWYKYPLKYVDIVTVISQFTKDKLIEYFRFPEERIRIIYDPVKPIFRYVKKERVNFPVRILMMGTGPHKNLNNLIEAVKDTGFHIDIIGWPTKEDVEKMHSYGISHTVYRNISDEQVNERYISCDILFNASFYEGFGMPIIEAQSVGRPVVTSNLGAMKEVAADSALLVDPHVPSEIREAITKLVKDPVLYDQMVALGKENIKAYQYFNIAMQYLNIYQEIA